MPTTLTYPQEYKYSITGLIEELEKIRDEHGELPVYRYDEVDGIIPLSTNWVQDGDNDLMLNPLLVLA